MHRWVEDACPCLVTTPVFDGRVGHGCPVRTWRRDVSSDRRFLQRRAYSHAAFPPVAGSKQPGVRSEGVVLFCVREELAGPHSRKNRETRGLEPGCQLPFSTWMAVLLTRTAGRSRTLVCRLRVPMFIGHWADLEQDILPAEVKTPISPRCLTPINQQCRHTWPSTPFSVTIPLHVL